MARLPIVGGNWKCNNTTQASDDLLRALQAGSWDGQQVQVVVCPVLLHVHRVAKALCKQRRIEVGVQNLAATGTGAFTGEVAACQVKDFGLQWAIIGHSERRTKYGEKDPVLAKKLEQAQANGLSAIFCIGETLAEREAGQTNAVCERQLAAVFPVIKDWSKIVIAYEPVWAIGTGKVATPAQAQEAHKNIRQFIAKKVGKHVAAAVRIQYGGSVTEANCKELMALPDVDGFLVGGASLKPGFVNICQAAAAATTGPFAGNELSCGLVKKPNGGQTLSAEIRSKPDAAFVATKPAVGKLVRLKNGAKRADGVLAGGRIGRVVQECQSHLAGSAAHLTYKVQALDGVACTWYYTNDLDLWKGPASAISPAPSDKKSSIWLDLGCFAWAAGLAPTGNKYVARGSHDHLVWGVVEQPKSTLGCFGF